MPRNTTAQFKAYATPTQSFQDYVALLRNNPRYAAALNTGSDVQAFAQVCSAAATRLTLSTQTRSPRLRTTVSSLKLSSTVPIPAKTGTL